MKYDSYRKYYTDDGFWVKLKKFAAKLGKKSVLHLLTLYYTMKDDDTPTWAKGVILGAIGYFILPLDPLFRILFPLPDMLMI